jgi:hypothetical protein
MRNPVIAGVLSLLIPGLGQIYNGRILFGVIWMLVFGISWIGSVGSLQAHCSRHFRLVCVLVRKGPSRAGLASSPV